MQYDFINFFFDTTSGMAITSKMAIFHCADPHRAACQDHEVCSHPLSIKEGTTHRDLKDFYLNPTAGVPHPQENGQILASIFSCVSFSTPNEMRAPLDVDVDEVQRLETLRPEIVYGPLRPCSLGQEAAQRRKARAASKPRETLNTKPETLSSKPETRNSKPQT